MKKVKKQKRIYKLLQEFYSNMMNENADYEKVAFYESKLEREEVSKGRTAI